LPNLKYYHGICLKLLTNTTNNLSEGSLSRDRDLNQEPSESEAGELTIQRRRSAKDAVDVTNSTRSEISPASLGRFI
jgi:hypothetical protein